MTPREKLRQIIEENPNADDLVLFEKFRRAAMNDPDLQRTIIEEVAAEPEGLDLIKKVLARAKAN